MDTSLVYAIVMGGSFLLLLLINGLPLIARLIRYLSPLVSKHLIYRYILHRHRLLGPWSRADVLVQLIYIAGNICCFDFWDTTISQVGLRAGTLAMINLIPLFAVSHLSTLADLLGVTLSTFRQIHRSAGVMAVMLTIFHALVMIASQPSFPLDRLQNKFAVIVSILQGHISSLTLHTGSIITRVHYSALSATLPLALLRTLPPHPSGLGRAHCLLYLATPALRESFPPHIPIYLGRTVSIHVHCPRVYGHPPKRCLPFRWRASPHYTRIWRSQGPHSASEAA
jgi:hypothetical protein